MMQIDAITTGTGSGAIDSHHRARMIPAKIVSIIELIKKAIRNTESGMPLPSQFNISQLKHIPRYALKNVTAIVPRILAIDVITFGITVFIRRPCGCDIR
jgi:hypothetical protein